MQRAFGNSFEIEQFRNGVITGLIFAMLIIFVLVLSGCEDDDLTSESTYYTKEEVDDMFDEQLAGFFEEIYDIYIEENEQDIAELQQLVDLWPDELHLIMNEYDGSFQSRHEDLLETIAELEARIEELEGE